MTPIFNKGRRRGKLLLCLYLISAVVLTNVLLYCYKSNGKDYTRDVDLPILHHSSLEQLISCYYEEGSTLPSADQLRPSANTIFFLESSCRGDIDSRQVCAVESAARANPKWEVYVLFLAPIKLEPSKHVTELKAFNNVKLARINLKEFSRGTPVESLVLGNAFNQSSWPVTHVSDVLRMLTLYKFGGVYLDLDVVVTKSFDTLPKNFGASESDDTIATGIVGLSKDDVGSKIADKLIRYIVKNYRGDDWTSNGPVALTQVIIEYCKAKVLTNITKDTCKGFELFGPKMFYPIYYTDFSRYFNPGDFEAEDVYMYHIWNGISESTKVQKDSPYSKFARKYCPNTFANHKMSFGEDEP